MGGRGTMSICAENAIKYQTMTVTLTLILTTPDVFMKFCFPFYRCVSHTPAVHNINRFVWVFWGTVTGVNSWQEWYSPLRDYAPTPIGQRH